MPQNGRPSQPSAETPAGSYPPERHDPTHTHTHTPHEENTVSFLHSLPVVFILNSVPFIPPPPPPQKEVISSTEVLNLIYNRRCG